MRKPLSHSYRSLLSCAVSSRALWVLFLLSLLYLSSLLSSPGSVRSGDSSGHPFHLVVAYESVPHVSDGAERYLASVVRALASLPGPWRPRVTFLARSTAGACAGTPGDAEALGPAVHIREAGPHSPEFLRLMAQPRTALLLPLSFFSSCSGPSRNSSSEDFAASLRSHPATQGTPLAVFAFDAQAFRLQGLAEHEPHPAQAARFAAAAQAEAAREAALYRRASVLVMLTPQDLAAIPPSATAPGAPRLVVGFRDAPQGPSSSSSPEARALAASRALPPFQARAGFAFLGSGNNPTNVLALHYFLAWVWPALRARLPSAQLHIVGPPPTRLCKEHAVWCGWLEGTQYGSQEEGSSGIRVHGLVGDPREVLAGVRVALAPLVTGTGINTKTGYYLGVGVPVVGTEKGIRGYEGQGGYTVAQLQQGGEAFAAACERLHEGREAWEEASLAALENTERMRDARDKAEDLKALVEMLQRM